VTPALCAGTKGSCESALLLTEFVKKHELGEVYPAHSTLSSPSTTSSSLTSSTFQSPRLVMTEKNIQGAPDLVVRSFRKHGKIDRTTKLKLMPLGVRNTGD